MQFVAAIVGLTLLLPLSPNTGLFDQEQPAVDQLVHEAKLRAPKVKPPKGLRAVVAPVAPFISGAQPIAPTVVTPPEAYLQSP